MSSDTYTTELFPQPNHDLLQLAIARPPAIWAGVTPASTSTLLHILKDNHKRWHIFCNELRFHNHTAHTLLALWSLGADEAILEAAYKQSSSVQRAAFASPKLIDRKNWKLHLGDLNFYDSYLKFFTGEVERRGSAAVLEEYVFSVNANTKSISSTDDPCMVTRLLNGVIHPLIHVGYGFEFGLPGLVAEGIAQAAVHPGIPNSKTIPESVFHEPTANTVKTKEYVHAFSILARVLADPTLEAGDYIEQFKFFKDTHDTHGDTVKAYVDQWTLEGPIEKKVEELVWMSALMYGVGGLQRGKSFNNDFFIMHILTSSLFLSPLVSAVSRRSQEVLLRSYMATCLVIYVGRGRPAIDIENFYNEAPATIVPPGVTPCPHASVLPSPNSQFAISPTPWLPIFQTTLVHPDDHLVKIQRALAHYASFYGSKSAGYLSSTELNGAERLDGSLFVRAAILTANKTGWIREGESPVGFARTGFYKTEEQGENVQPYAVYNDNSMYYKK